MNRVLGVDIGGVVIDRVNDNTDTSFFGNNYLRTTMVPGAFNALWKLVIPLEGNVHLVSKCGQRIQEKTEHWLKHHRFFELTGVPSSHLHFCRERHEKAGICQKLGITHFVDDRLEVLGHLIGSVPNLFLFRPQDREMQKFAIHLAFVHVVQEWQDIETAFGLRGEGQ